MMLLKVMLQIYGIRIEVVNAETLNRTVLFKSGSILLPLNNIANENKIRRVQGFQKPI